MQVRMYVTKVTPEMAELWLTANTRNRKLSTKLVEDYARDMLNNRWALNGEAIKIAVDGTILDGQHRLAAIVESETAIEMVVIEGLDPESQATMDSGRKRTLADNLSIHEVDHAPLVAAIAYRMWMWDRGDVNLTRTLRPTQSEQRAWIDENPVVQRAAQIAYRTRATFKPLTPSTTGTAYVLFNRIDPDKTAEFFAQLGSGAGLEEGDPILMLRSRITRDAVDGRKNTDKVRLALLIKAWNHSRRGEKVGGLLMTDSNKMPIPE